MARVHRAAELVVAAILTASAPPAMADCPLSSWSTPIPVRISPEDHPRNVVNAARYQNNTHHVWYLHAARNLTKLRASVTTWDTEAYYDYLRADGGGFSHTFWGPLPAGYNSPDWLPFSAADGLDGKFFRLTWHTDATIDRENIPLLGEVQVKCTNLPVANTAQGPLLPGRKYDGLLYQSTNKVYFWYSQPPGQRLYVFVRGLAGSAGADFDLFADTSNAQPGPGSPWSSTSTAMDEAVYIPDTSVTRNVYVGVHSYSGVGHFQLQVHARPVLAPGSGLRICSQDPIPTGANWNTFVDSLKSTSLRLSSATQGSRLVSTWSVVKIPPCGGSISNREFSLCEPTCDVSVTPADLADACGPLALGYAANYGRYRIPRIDCYTYADPWAPMVHVHEMAHARWGLPDEYAWADPPQANLPFCGHSLMNGPGTHVFCNGFDHCRDGYNVIPPGFDCTASASMWSRLLATGGGWPGGPGADSANPSHVYLINAGKAFANVNRTD